MNEPHLVITVGKWKKREKTRYVGILRPCSMSMYEAHLAMNFDKEKNTIMDVVQKEMFGQICNLLCITSNQQYKSKWSMKFKRLM